MLAQQEKLDGYDSDVKGNEEIRNPRTEYLPPRENQANDSANAVKGRPRGEIELMGTLTGECENQKQRCENDDPEGGRETLAVEFSTVQQANRVNGGCRRIIGSSVAP